VPEPDDHDQRVGDLAPGWAPRPEPARVRLTGRYVALEPLTVEHTADLHRALCGPDDRWLWTYRQTGPPADIDGLAVMVEEWATSRDSVTWALVPTGGRAAGMITFTGIEPSHGRVEVASVIYARSLQRTTAATEAIHLAMRYALDDLGYRRFEWKCDSLNEPSRRAAARLGFDYEGRFRRHMVTKGRNRDTDWFSVTDADWPRVRAAHEQWLDPANFDEAGEQRASLSALTCGRLPVTPER
jgi:RimJ/RimL family protein N-acetyltransferase